MAKVYVTPPVVDEVRKTPEYKALLELGLIDTSSKLIVNNSNFRFSGDILGVNNVYDWSSRNYSEHENTITIYGNGYVRTDRGRPAQVPSLNTGDLVTLKDWRDKLEGVRLFVLRNCILKDHLGVASRVAQVELTKGGNAEFVMAMLKRVGPEFFGFLGNRLPDLIQYISPDALAKEILANPGAATEFLKEFSKLDTVRKAIDLLPVSITGGFEEELGVKSDLKNIGF